MIATFWSHELRKDVVIPKDIADFLIQRDVNADVDNAEFERLQTLERMLRELVGIIDSHEIELGDCDRRGHLHCDCLHRQMKKIKMTMEGITPQDIAETNPPRIEES